MLATGDPRIKEQLELQSRVTILKSKKSQFDKEQISARDKLTFEYPKTWSVYVAKDAHSGGDFEAYFNPVEVNEVSNETIAALRVKIVNRSFDDVAADYQRDLEGDEPRLKLESVTIGNDNKITANRYTGKIPNTEFTGYIVIFKIRDKTAIMQTDSVLFESDYNNLLGTVRFNA